MVTLYKKYLGTISGLLLFIIQVTFSYAADFNVLPRIGNFSPNQEVEVNLKIDSAGKDINAAQAKINFPPNVLGVKSISKNSSVFNFWLQEPKFSNTAGTIEFIGGTPNGVSGASLQVLKITFISKGVGAGDISFVDSSITTADDSGTNVISRTNGAQFVVTSAVGFPDAGHTIIPSPIPVIRKPIPTVGLPIAPIVNVELYHNPASWHNQVSQFTAAWQLPPDISGLSTAFNSNPTFAPSAISEGLFESRVLPEISKDGLYYFHIRFQNNKGWGPTTHYRIAVDTQPPLPFKIDVRSGLASDNPSPVLSFQTEDTLSGMDYYVVKVNGDESVKIGASGGEVGQVGHLEVIQTGIGYLNVRDVPSTSGKLVTTVNPGERFEYTEQVNGWYKIKGLPSEALTKEGWVTGTYVKLLTGEGTAVTESGLEYKMSPREPGIYMVSVQAIDRAGNSVEDRIKIEVLPIEAPVISSITERVILDSGNPLVINGTAIPGVDVIVTIEDSNEFIVLQNDTKANLQGGWEFSLDKNLRRGSYLVSVKARDSRGALSLPTEPVRVRFMDKPIISLFGWDITTRGLSVTLVLVAMLAALWFYRKTLMHLAKSQRGSIIISRDIKNSFDVVKEDLDKIPRIVKKKRLPLKTKAAEVTEINEKIKENLDKIEDYSSRDIEKLK